MLALFFATLAGWLALIVGAVVLTTAVFWLGSLI